jgi:hypothetical protein
MGGILLGLGGLLCFIGWVWLIIVAGKSSGVLWAVIVFFFNWLGGLIFCIVKKTGWTQWGLMVIGFVLMMIGAFMSGGATYSFGTTP